MHNALNRLGTLRVRDVMTRQAVCVRKDDPLERATAAFAAKEVSCVPVVDDAGRCVGMLSAVDFVDGRRMSSLPGETNGHSKNPRFVQEIMSPDVRWVSEDELLIKAAHVMCARHIHRLPVLDANHHVVGIVSTMDVVSAMINALDEAKASQFKQ